MDVEGITSGRSNGKEICFYFVCLAEECGCGKKIRQFLPSANHDKICSYEHFNCENFTLQKLSKNLSEEAICTFFNFNAGPLVCKKEHHLRYT